MRITGGLARSIQLKTLDLPELRPATDQIRQALFNSIGEAVVGARFLDLFAGSGSYGLEAFSRGAAGGIFVEQNAKLKAIISQNLAAVAKSAGLNPADCQVRQMDALAFAPEEEAFDLLFCDPPYAMIAENWPRLGEIASRALKARGLWCMEHPAGLSLPLPKGFELLRNLGGKGKGAPNMAICKKL